MRLGDAVGRAPGIVGIVVEQPAVLPVQSGVSNACVTPFGGLRLIAANRRAEVDAIEPIDEAAAAETDREDVFRRLELLVAEGFSHKGDDSQDLTKGP